MITIEYSSAWWPTRRIDTFRGILQQEAYYLGELPPRYPVPTTLGVVQLQAYPGIVCIDTPDTDNYVWAYDQWQHKQVFPLID